MAAARGIPIPAPDEIPPELGYRMSPKSPEDPRSSDKNLKNLTVPISSRSQSFNSDTSSNLSPSHPAFSLPSPSSPLTSAPTSSPLFRGRSKTLASLTTSSKNNSQADMTPRELNLPKDPFVNGQPIEAYLYKDASECPICFLYYPPYLNMTRCCDQPICSECFVQIKRPDPHPPEHEQNDPTAPATPDVEREAQSDGQLVSEPASCPFCKQPEFGITYAAPPFRRGLTYASNSGGHPLAKAASAMSSSSSLSSATGNLQPGESRRRATSLSANAPTVITTDKVRPGWAQKLATARAHTARRSAAATALHTAAYLMGNGGHGADARSFGGFGRRGVLRRGHGSGSDSPSGGTNSAHLNALALLAERHNAVDRGEGGTSADGPPAIFLAPPRGSSRRSRMDDLEDMMMMEAIRLSLASEEERRKRGEKEAKKEAKKKDKETKKAEKAAKKSGLYTNNTNMSNSGLDSPASGTFGRVESGASSVFGDEPTAAGKGKAVDRAASATPPPGTSPSVNQEYPTSSDAVPVPGISLSGTGRHDADSSPPSPFVSSALEPQKRSHLRHMSNASSSASSMVESVSGSALHDPMSNTPPLEPMFNFRSLAAMIGDEEKGEGSAHVEDAEQNGQGTGEKEDGQNEVHQAGGEPSLEKNGHESKPDEANFQVKGLNGPISGR